MSLKLRIEKDGVIHATKTDDGTDDVAYEWDGIVPPLHIRVSELFLWARDCGGEGSRVPPWYYGLSYVDLYGRVYVYHLIPVNWLVRAARWVEFLWFRVRCQRSWFDIQLDAAYQCGREQGIQYERDRQRAASLTMSRKS